jgi:hypothetical protein
MYTAFTWTRRLATALALLLRLRRPAPPPLQDLPSPHQLRALQLLQVQLHQARNLHQLLEVEQLAASWLEAPLLEELRHHLHLRLAHLQTRPASPRSTSSRRKTARRTGKRRR